MGGKAELDSELDGLQRRLPSWGARLVESVRHIGHFWVRVPAALGLIIGGVLGFLPILGFWMLPLGLALLARDVPFLRAPLTRCLAFINRQLDPRPS